MGVDGGGQLLSLDRVAPREMVDASASVISPWTIKVQKISSGTGSPRWSWKKGCNMVMCVCVSKSENKVNLDYLAVLNYLVGHSMVLPW